MFSLREDAALLRNSHQNTALRSAIAAGQLEASKLLVRHGADVHQTNHGGSSLMEAASIPGHHDMVIWLGEHGLEIGLLELSSIGDLNGVRKYIDANPSSVDESDRRGLTALHRAANCGHVDVVELLISAGANIRATNRHSHEPLSIAVEGKQARVVECLLDNGADPNALGGHYSGTVLHRAVLHRSLPIVDALLSANADPNRRDANGKTPLHDAIGVGNAQIVARFLESSKLDLSLRSGKTKFSAIGETPLEYAQHRGKARIAQMLVAQTNPS